MFALIRKSLQDFKQSFAKYLSFELAYTFLASVLIIPFLTYLFNKMFMQIGKGETLLNNDVYQLGFSFNGLIGMFTISLLAVAVLFVQFGTLIIISQKSYFKQAFTISESFLTAARRLPKLLGLGIFQLFFLLLLVIPFLDASTLPPLFDINASLLISELFQQSFAMKLTYLGVILGGVYLYIRWVFALHFIFIENKSIAKSMAASWRLTKRNKFRLVLMLISLNVLIAGISFLLVSLFSQLGTIFESKIFGDFIGNYLLLFSSYAAVLFSLFFFPMNMIMLTRLYHEARQPERDELILKGSPFAARIETNVKQMYQHKKGFVISGIAVGIAGVILVNSFIQDSIVYLPWNVTVAAHKGDSIHAPENSISSVKSSIANGIDMVEIDVTLTKDNVLVLSHDPDLKRMADIPDKIRDLTYEEIKHIDIGSSFDKSFQGETIPTLDEILRITTEADTGILIDVKVNEDEDVYAEKIVDLVEKYKAEDLTLVQSFNQQFLGSLRQRNENIRLGQILYLYAGTLSDLDVDFYTVRETMLTKRFIRRAQKENRGIWVWTVNSERSIRKVLSYDVDGIITDYPERVERMISIKTAGEAKE